MLGIELGSSWLGINDYKSRLSWQTGLQKDEIALKPHYLNYVKLSLNWSSERAHFSFTLVHAKKEKKIRLCQMICFENKTQNYLKITEITGAKYNEHL